MNTSQIEVMQSNIIDDLQSIIARCTVLQELDNLCRKHDWGYFLSDDHRAYAKGRESWWKIKAVMQKAKNLGIDNGIISSTIQRYCPDGDYI